MHDQFRTDFKHKSPALRASALKGFRADSEAMGTRLSIRLIHLAQLAMKVPNVLLGHRWAGHRSMSAYESETGHPLRAWKVSKC